MNPSRQVIRPPDKGSFPLDHFHDCNNEAKEYANCMTRHQMMPKRCRNFQRKYLECRMKAGLMEQTDFESLGFGENLDWDSEEQERKNTYSKIEQVKERARNRVVGRFGDLPKPMQDNFAPDILPEQKTTEK